MARSASEPTERAGRITVLLGILATVVTIGALGGLFFTLIQPSNSLNSFQILLRVILVTLGLSLGVRQAIILVLSLVGRRGKAKPEATTQGEQPTISIVMPAYNESENIRSSIQSVLELAYPSIELLIIDDGSSDDTYDIAKPYEGIYPGRTVVVIRKENGGKSSALNMGFSLSTADFVLMIDADTQIARNALGYMIEHMADPTVDAVAGQVMVRNRSEVLTRLQALEYLIANSTIRAAQSFSKNVLLVPGPIGLFRRSALEAVAEDLSTMPERDPYDPQLVSPVSEATFAEDFETSLRVLVNGGGITYEPRAVSQTRAPDNMQTLINQRYRWIRGHFQVSRLYLQTLNGASSPKLKFWMWLTFLFDIYVMPLANVTIFLTLLMGVVLAGNIGLFIAISIGTYLIFASIFAYSIASQRAPFTLMAVTPIFIFYQTFVLTGAYIIALIDETRRIKMEWN